MALQGGEHGTLGERLFIVPASHTRIVDLSFQVEMYELFHRTPTARAGHMIGTSTLLFGVFVLASHAPGILAPLLAAALIVWLAVCGFTLDRLTGLITALYGIALAIAAQRSRLGMSMGVALTLVGCAAQTFSHLFEDVPPPLSGTTGFVSFRAWFWRLDALQALRAAAQTLVIFYWLEFWAGFRILPLQVLHLLMRAGRRPRLRSALDARIAEILADSTSSWKHPRVTGSFLAGSGGGA
jgi:hypothetical protein